MPDNANERIPSVLYQSLEPLFRPRGVAIVGASATPFKQGNVALKYLIQGGYEGRIYPVNPSRGMTEGLAAYGSIVEIDGPVDCALFVIPASGVIRALEECAKVGVRSVVVGANGFAELGTEEGRTRQSELTRIAREYGIRVVGPNTNGIWNATDKLSLGYNTSHGDPMTPGPVSIAAHSGALFNSIAPSLRRFGAGLSKFVPVGNEADLDILDFLEYFIEDPATSVIALIVEALRDGARMKSLAARAHTVGKPIIALKLGRSEAGAGAALAHSSRMAGSARAYDALFRECGVLQAPSIEAVAGACALLSAPVPEVAADKRGLICISTSGGGGGLVADFASEYDIPLAGNPDGSWGGKTGELITTFEGAGPIFNPIDGGNLAGWPRLERLLECLESEGQTGPALFFGHMLPQARADMAVAEIITRRKQRAGSPVVCVAPGGLRPEVTDFYIAHGIPVFTDIATCFMALRCLYRAWNFKGVQFTQAAGLSAPDAAIVTEQLRQHGPEALLSEIESAAVLRAAGLKIVISHVINSADEAVAHAQRVGYPVVLKGLAPGVAHKADAGLVAVGLRNDIAIREAFLRLSGRLSELGGATTASQIILQPMVSAQAELIIGVAHEPPLGQFLLLGLGGVQAEVMDEVILLPTPLTGAAIRNRIEESKIGQLLARIGREPARTDRLLKAVTDNLVALQNLLALCGDRIAGVDVNPLLVLEDDCMGVDALIALRRP
jgi:acyl-CoA synthetase (NDP forming)